MAIAVDGSSPIRWTSQVGGGSASTSASFTAPANALLVACPCSDGTNAQTDPNPVIADSGGLTWTKQIERDYAETTDGGYSAIWTARTVSSVARTVSFTPAGTSQVKRVSTKVYVLTVADVDGTPVDTVGASNEGGSTTNSLTTSSITAGAAGLLIAADTDFNQLGVFTSSDLTIDTADYAGEVSVMSGYKAVSNGASVNGNLNAGGSAAAQHKWCQIVVREAAAAGRTTKNTRAFPLGTEIGMHWGGQV